MAWNTYDTPNPVCINLNMVWIDLKWKKLEKYIFKLQKLIYRASSRGQIRKMPLDQKTSDQKLPGKIASY